MPFVTENAEAAATLQIKWTLQLSASMPQLVSLMVDNLAWMRMGNFLRNCTRGPMGFERVGPATEYVVTGDGQIRGVRDEDWIYRFGEYGC